MPDPISQQKILDTIVRGAMKHEYDAGKMITNAGAFAAAVRQRALDNETAVPGSLQLAYNAAAKQLAAGEPHLHQPAAFIEDEPVDAASEDEAARWQRIIALAQSVERDHPLRQAIRNVAGKGDALQALAHLELVAQEST